MHRGCAESFGSSRSFAVRLLSFACGKISPGGNLRRKCSARYRTPGMSSFGGVFALKSSGSAITA